MKKPRTCSSFTTLIIPLFAGLLLSASATFAADEICTSCGPQVSVTGSFTHHKDGPLVAIEGATNAAAFREDVNGTNFSVTISGLPASKYTISISAAEMVASAADEVIVRPRRFFMNQI